MFLAAGVLIYLSAFRRDIMGIYTYHSDADVIYIGQVLGFNAGLPLTYFDHTGFLLILLLAAWLRLLGTVGFIDSVDIRDLPAADNFADFLAPAIFAGRFLSLVTGLLFVMACTWMVWRLTRRRWLAGLAALLVASSGGVVFGAFEIRPELMSTAFFLMAMVCMFRAQRTVSNYWLGPVGAGVFIYLALLTKVQTIPAIMALPVFALLAAPRWPGLAGLEAHMLPARLTDASSPAKRCQRALLVLVLLFPCCLFVWMHLSYLVDNLESYHWIAGTWLALALLAYQHLRLRSWPAVRVWLGLLVLGLSLGFLPYFLHRNPKNIAAIVSVVDYTRRFVTNPLQFEPVQMLKQGLWVTLSRCYDLTRIFTAPWVALSCSSLAMGLYLCCNRRRRVALLGLAFVGLALALEVLFTLRQLTITYYAYIDYLHVIGFCVLAAELLASADGPWTKRCLRAAIVAVAGWSALIIARHTAYRIDRGTALQPPANLCAQAVYSASLRKDLLRRAGSPEACADFVVEDMTRSRYAKRWHLRPDP